MIWTDEQCDKLRRLYATGISASEIGDQLGGITRNAVIGKCTRLGLTREWHNHGRPQDHKPKKQPKPRRMGGSSAPKSDALLNRIVAPEIADEPYVEAVDDYVPPVKQRRTVFELTDSTCRWPIGHPCNKDFYFCGGQAVTSQPYCTHHCRIAYRPGPMRRPYHPPRGQAA